MNIVLIVASYLPWFAQSKITEVTCLLSKSAVFKSSRLFSVLSALSHFECYERAQNYHTTTKAVRLQVIDDTCHVFVCFRTLFDEQIGIGAYDCRAKRCCRQIHF
jgi:hypothetical protein